MHIHTETTRRRFLMQAASSAVLLASPGVFAEVLQATPRQTEGPYYPNHLPLDTDNDLIVVNDTVTQAVGEITHLSGRVLDLQGNPVRNALVEIWQVDSQGIYVHTGDPKREAFDTNFQGFGRFLTSGKGEYYFRTIKPVIYGGENFQRTPHIHFALHVKGQPKFTTQCYILGEPSNDRDGVLRNIKDEKARASVIVPFTPIPESPARELAASFDIVLGLTPATA